MPAQFLLDVFAAHAGAEAVAGPPGSETFGDLLRRYEAFAGFLEAEGIGPRAVVAIEAEYSAASIAALIALVMRRAVIVPLGASPAGRRDELLEIAEVEYRLAVNEPGGRRLERTGRSAGHELYRQLGREEHPGLVLFTSGSSGTPKGVVHDLTRLLAKYRTPRHRLRTLLFLLFDHIGGFDTLFQALSNGSTVIVPADRTPESVCAAIARHRAEVLPASPSFLAMLLLSEAHRRHDLSSLRYITYGAEVMPTTTLRRLAAEFPGVTLLQKYGLTEVGTLRSRSASNDSLLVKLGGEGFETRVVDGILQIRAHSSMLGYLNAPSPITEDGWLVTGDIVEQHGEFLRIRGRDSDLINVGGQKVYPAEVENVILEVPGVLAAAVRGEPHPLTGQVVVARVTPETQEDPLALERRVRGHCRGRLAPYQVPVRVEVSDQPLHTERAKILRRE